jgi:hypothetical protein
MCMIHTVISGYGSVAVQQVALYTRNVSTVRSCTHDTLHTLLTANTSIYHCTCARCMVCMRIVSQAAGAM